MWQGPIGPCHTPAGLGFAPVLGDEDTNFFPRPEKNGTAAAAFLIPARLLLELVDISAGHKRIARREVNLREKTLWRRLYETAGRADEIRGVNIEGLDFSGRRCPVKAKGARIKARRRGQAREDVVLETVYWDAGTARLLPRRSPSHRSSRGWSRGTGQAGTGSGRGCACAP